ncbi:hypothetical protein EHEL_060090 [Encephalitozoon hellem ATCC 50504]|uniref:Pumilio-like protein n=1 Tax=Encephalitozoon hellem TaxID=27973 RepID=A0A9Q9CAF7_ENCHE|nr:uncharacterized protein EHEL_060090 [Encephalitozoon hellem ATCC 50504]AFM98383.1 hypothetical protein EHEL_060090 [Encephalitozoon hellem ATCC 50504]UTX43303.1 pumilio-like protein [Encephalitozoon hellem]WEL38764.1 pumilio-like protein [Encephalitozoon hellem]|eukprot:XP_003887364.1 hypothetical protein EHEL_060090 [Encephalitozoon hellem ATCC 50504]
MNSLKEYVKNIDFGIVDDPEVLDNVYNEIEGNEKELVLDAETTHQMEILIRKSNSKQILDLFEKLDVERLMSKKLGSRVIEVIYDAIFDMVYIQRQDVDIDLLVKPVENILETKFSDTNATHIIRKLFQLVSGKRIIDGRIQSFNSVKPGHIEKYKEIIMELIPKLSKEDSFITLLSYLYCYRSKTIVLEVVKHHFTWERVCDPSMSYFFEKIVGISGKKAREYIFENLKDRVMELCKEKCGNYFIGEFILCHYQKADYFFDVIDLSEFDKNSNIVMKLTHSLLKARSYSNIDKIMKEFYLESGDDIISCTFGGVEGNFKQKYAPMLCELMKLPNERNYGINTAFRKSFSSRWIRSKGGIELLQGYYEGADDGRSKRSFTKHIEEHLPLIVNRKGCDAILEFMRMYGSQKAVVEIRKRQQSVKKVTPAKPKEYFQSAKAAPEYVGTL